MQTSEQLNAFRALCKANNLGKADVWQHKQSGNWIIGRAGIEKIQGLNNIQVGIELAAAGVDFAVVKAAAARTVERKKIKVESLGSANAKNSQVSYYAEMAEKRAKSRSILMLMGFYELGVYGEEEADDFKESRNQGAVRLDDIVEQSHATEPRPMQAVPGEPEVSAPASEAPAPSATAAQSSAPTERATEAQLQQLVQLIASPELDVEERDMLLSMPVDQRPAAWVEKTLKALPSVVAERKDAKTALAAAQKQLRTTAARFQKDMPDSAYQAILLRASAITAKPAELRAESRALLAQFQPVTA